MCKVLVSLLSQKKSDADRVNNKAIKGQWIIDIGALNHMTGELNVSSDLRDNQIFSMVLT